MKSLHYFLIILAFSSIVSCWVDHFYYDNDDDDDFTREIEENIELKRRLTSSTVRLPINTNEITGLQYLYNSTNGDSWSWNNDTGTYGIPWNFTASSSLLNPCYDHWQGIMCSCDTNSTLNVPYDDDDYYYSVYYDDQYNYYDDAISYPSIDRCHITKIYLPYYNLVGLLPAEMFMMLPNLTHLHLEYNSLYSPLPTSMNQSSIILLIIDGNYFQESLDIFGSVNTLQFLSIYDNGFTGDLSPLQHLTRLTYLNLESNQLTGTLATGNLNKLQDLKVLYLYDNALSGNLSAISQLFGLKRLVCDVNYFTGSMEHIQNLTNLEVIVLSSNSFTGSLLYIQNHSKLTGLQIDYNHFTGTLEHIQNLTGLLRLWLNSNHFSGSVDYVQNFTELRFLWLESNQFTGPIDSIGSNLFQLRYCLLGSNFFTGSIEAVQNLHHLQILLLEYNYFSGSISAVNGNMTNLQFLRLNYNFFTGPLTSLSRNFFLSDLELYGNKFTGNIEALTNMSYLQVVYLSNNLFTGSLGPLVSLERLEYCILDRNLFTGSIPSLYNTLRLYMFSVGNNLLTGSLLPYGFFNNISIINVANNMLSGELPMELFLLPKLSVLSAGINCMTARFNDLVCNSSELDTLLLDGLHSSFSCRSTIPIHLYDTIYASSKTVSSIPPCIYSLPNITSLHLSGNGITGSLPTDAVINDRFEELVLSNNEFRSIIPEAFQNHKWDVFDVSYNKFNGPLSSSLDITSIARLKINRLSGDIPSSLYNSTDVAVLTGNIFACTNEELVRLRDEVQDRYVCGSDSFTTAGILWCAIVLFVLVTIGLSYVSYNDGNTTALYRWIASMLKVLHRLRSRLLSSPIDMTTTTLTQLKVPIDVDEINQFVILGQTVRFATGLIAGIFVCVHLPLYCIFSTYYATYIITYAWAASAAYLSGVVPGVILLLLYLCTIVVPSYYYRSYLRRVLLLQQGDNARSIINGSGDRQTKKERHVSMISVMTLILKTNDTAKETIEIVRKRFISMILISVVNLIFVGTLNIVYVLNIERYNSALVTLVNIGMGVFKAVWTNMVIVEVIGLFEVHYIKSVSNKMDGQRLSFLSFTSILNNIVIPCIALSIESPNCFFNLIYSRVDVKSSYSENKRLSIYAFFTIIRYDSEVTFTPPYTYSYQCSSTILTTYVVIFLYSALFGLMSQLLRDIINENLYHSSLLGSSKRNTNSSNKMTSIAPLPPPVICNEAPVSQVMIGDNSTSVIVMNNSSSNKRSSPS